MKNERRDMEHSTVRSISGPSVKDMPVYDPDAEITGLILTIPSWSGSIDRLVKRTDLTVVSAEVKEQLASVLLSLKEKISETLTVIGVE